MIGLAAACVCLAVMLWPARGAAVIRPQRRVAQPSWRQIRRRRQQRGDVDAVAAMLEGIAPALAAGVTPTVAVSTSASLAAGRVAEPALREDLMMLARQASSGAELAPVWARMHARHHIPALDDIARAWALSERLGAPIGDALRAATAMLREHLDLHRQIAAATAGPRATMQLLTVLPLLGVVIASLIGVPPWQLYAGRLGVTVLVLGALLVIGGRGLTRRMIRRAGAAKPLS